MPPLRDDYLLRTIEQAFQVLRRILRRKMEIEIPAALDEIDAATAELLGPAAPVVQRLDAATAVPLLADARRAALWARLLAERAELLVRSGDPRADEAALRALEVALEARELARTALPLGPEIRAALDDAVTISLARVPSQRLAERFRVLLGR
jgi:hypothetical protein